MRLLLVTFDPPENVGGVEGRASAYARELTEMGNFVELMALAPRYKETSDTLQGGVVKRYPSSATKVLSTFKSAVDELAARSIDSVFLLSGALTLFGCLLLLQAKLTRRRSLIFLYGKDLLSAKTHPFRRLFLLASSLLADRVATNSRFTSTLVPVLAAKKAGILYPGVDPRATLLGADFGQSSTDRILFVGRLVRRKGVDDLLRAFDQVKQELPAAMVEIVGDGPERRRLAALAQELGIGDRVRFQGELRGNKLHEAYARATVVVGPSRSSEADAEGFGTVFIEAGLFAKACLGTRSGGIPDAIQDGRTGILVPEASPRDLGQAMLALLTDKVLRTRLGENGRKRVLSEFTWRVSTLRLVRLLSP